MEIHLLRNATLILRFGKQQILVDPMLSPPHRLPPFAVLRHPPRRNPLVPLPANTESLLEPITTGLITHCRRGHIDHLDRPGAARLARLAVPVYCQASDAAYLRRRGIMAVPLNVAQPYRIAGGTLTAIPAMHGYGILGRLMGAGVGYLLEAPGEPTIYLTGDTVLTPTVRRVLTEVQPQVVILTAGGASLDIGRPILMPLAEIHTCLTLTSGTVIATHLEALNHCPITRQAIRAMATRAGVAHKLHVPEDGECFHIQ